MAVQFRISVSHRPPATVLKLAGELDLATAGLLGEALTEQLRNGRTTLVVDTSSLRFCDLTGLDALMEGRAAAESAGGSLRLSGVHGVLARVLEVTRICEELRTHGPDLQHDADDLTPAYH
jgi:anti-sigma B factor antagonist